MLKQQDSTDGPFPKFLSTTEWFHWTPWSFVNRFETMLRRATEVPAMDCNNSCQWIMFRRCLKRDTPNNTESQVHPWKTIIIHLELLCNWRKYHDWEIRRQASLLSSYSRTEGDRARKLGRPELIKQSLMHLLRPLRRPVLGSRFERFNRLVSIWSNGHKTPPSISS